MKEWNAVLDFMIFVLVLECVTNRTCWSEGFTCRPGWCKALKYYRTAQNSCLLCIHWFPYTLKVIMVSSPQTVEVISGTLRGHQLSTTHTFRFVLRGEDAAVQKSWFSWRQKQAGVNTNKMQSKHASSYCSSRWELSSGPLCLLAHFVTLWLWNLAC